MEKAIKMSLKTAQKLWKKLNDLSIPVRVGQCPETRDPSEYELLMKEFLLENFTKEELEGKKGFTWEDSFDNCGYFINDHSKIRQITNSGLNIIANKTHDRNLFKTEKQALSALAFAQLSHIVAKYNEKPWKITDNDVKAVPPLWFITDKLLIMNDHSNYHGLGFGTREDAELSLKVNRQLWEQYWMI